MLVEKRRVLFNNVSMTSPDLLTHNAPERTTRTPLDIVVDTTRADEVLGTLLKRYWLNKYPYNLETTRVPHHPDHMPETMPRDGVEHASFLWAVCYYMRGGIKSVEAVKRLASMYDDDESRHLFDFTQAQSVDVDEVDEALKKHGLGLRTAVARQWVENAGRMTERYDGDPRKIFDNVTDYDEALTHIQNDGKSGGFKGFQHKMTSMIIYYLLDDKLIHGFDHFPIPVDLHVMRMSIAHEMVTFPNADESQDLFQPEVTTALRELYVDYARRHDVSAIDLCNAVWLYSEALCGYQPGNITLEPDGRSARNGRQTNLVPLEFDPTDENQRKAYERTCGSCAIRSTCVWDIPGKPYYVTGKMRRRGKRQEYPLEPTLFDGTYGDFT